MELPCRVPVFISTLFTIVTCIYVCLCMCHYMCVCVCVCVCVIKVDRASPHEHFKINT